jgi:hypothetical protein
MRADVLGARNILAVALRQNPEVVPREQAVTLAGGSWWVEDILALASTDRLLGEQGRRMLGELRPLVAIPGIGGFEDELRALLEEATPERRRPGDHPAQHLLLRLLGVLWTLTTGKSVSATDRDDTPFTRFLEAMLDPLLGLPGIAGHPAAVELRHNHELRAMARNARGPKRMND